VTHCQGNASVPAASLNPRIPPPLASATSPAHVVALASQLASPTARQPRRAPVIEPGQRRLVGNGPGAHTRLALLGDLSSESTDTHALRSPPGAGGAGSLGWLLSLARTGCDFVTAGSCG
jgi:hypothetical protein